MSVCLSISVSLSVYLSVLIYLSVCMCMCICMCMHVCIQSYVYACLYIRMYLFLRNKKRMYMYVITHTAACMRAKTNQTSPIPTIVCLKVTNGAVKTRPHLFNLSCEWLVVFCAVLSSMPLTGVIYTCAALSSCGDCS